MGTKKQQSYQSQGMLECRASPALWSYFSYSKHGALKYCTLSWVVGGIFLSPAFWESYKDSHGKYFMCGNTFPTSTGPGTCKSPACKIVCNLPAHTIISDSSNNLTPRTLSNIDTLMPSPKPAKPRGWGHLKGRWEPLKHWEKILHKQKMKCYSRPIWTDESSSIYTRCRHDLTMVKPPSTWLRTCFVLSSRCERRFM